MRFGLVGLFFAITFISCTAHAKYASFVIDMDTKEVLHEENADTKNYPASLTKMMTLYMLFDEIRIGRFTLNSKLPVSRKAARVTPTKIGLRPGQMIRVEDAILALTVKSANDVAVVVAETISGSEAKFAKKMTAKAHELGMGNTYFRNASGLPNRGQLSSARDMAMLGIALMRDFPQYYHYFSTKKWKFKGRVYRNHNGLLYSYEGTDGIKTGYTRKSGYNLVASVKRNGHRLLAVVFGGKSKTWRSRHITYLLNKGFGELSKNE